MRGPSGVQPGTNAAWAAVSSISLGAALTAVALPGSCQSCSISAGVGAWAGGVAPAAGRDDVARGGSAFEALSGAFVDNPSVASSAFRSCSALEESISSSAIDSAKLCSGSLAIHFRVLKVSSSAKSTVVRRSRPCSARRTLNSIRPQRTANSVSCLSPPFSRTIECTGKRYKVNIKST